MRFSKGFRHTRSSSDGLRITPGTRNDIGEIDELYVSVGWSSPGGIRARDNFLLARHRRVLAGTLMYWLEDPDIYYLQDDPPAPYADNGRMSVSEVLVASDSRRSGVGRRLMHAAAAAAMAEGISWMRVEPSPRGSEAERTGRIRFFEACGFRTWRWEPHLEMVGAPAVVLSATNLT
jgi:GNAT superfamily N-acetyltransferase